MADPIKSNLLSNTCSDITSSNCVAWGGPAISGLSICKGASITDVIMQLQSTCCGSSAPINPCITGNWVDFNLDIASSVTGVGCSLYYNYSGSYTTLISPTLVIATDNPMYLWTADGNLKIRGTININIGFEAPSGWALLKLTTIPATCFPNNWKSQLILVDISSDQSAQRFIKTARAYLVLDAGSNQLQLLIITNTLAGLSNDKFVITFGGTEFNLV